MMKRFVLAVLLAVSALPATAQDKDKPAFKPEELEQLMAPIALHPDALLAQILMASTYPLEVVEAARWSKANPGLKDKALEDALQKQGWEPSVKSLTAFPQVLAMMNEKLDWTQKLGDAFLAQQKELMEAAQRLRKKAQEAGNLKSGKEQTVSSDQQGGSTVIKVEPANPEVVYVPTYNPAVVYGPWPYPAYPPYYYYPPGYAAGTAFFAFSVGIIVGSAMWGHCNWHGGGVYINVNHYNNFNKTNIKSGDWNHQVDHRKGVQYRDQASRDKFGQGGKPGVDTREQFRGRADQGRQDLAAGDRMSDRPGTGDRGGDRGAGGRDSVGDHSRGGSAFNDVGRGSQTRDASNRGGASRGGGMGGGGMRGGGGGRGGGRR